METEEKFFWGALIGCAIGAGAALMLTPFSGVSLRRRIVDGLNHFPNQPKKLTHHSSHVRIPRQRASLSRENHSGHTSRTSTTTHSSHSRRPPSPTKSASIEKHPLEKDSKRNSPSKMTRREHPALKAHHHK